MTILEILLTLSLLSITAGFALFTFISLKEGHRRGARLSGLFTLLSLLLLAVVQLAPTALQIVVAVTLGIALAVLIVFFLWPTQQTIPPSPPPNTRVDERTTIFARARLVPNSPEYDAYYTDHPEHQALDDAFRANPGLLAPGARFYDDLLASSPGGSFFLTEALREAVDGPMATQWLTAHQKT
jgi:hypothetical protein